MEAHIDHVDAPEAGTDWTGATGASWLAEQVSGKTPKHRRALVLAADMGEETLALCRSGFTTLVVDPSREALATLKGTARRHGANPTLIRADFFGCSPALFGPVELIWDRTLFHRLHAVQHAAWAHKAARILPSNGWMLGLFRIGRSAEGPPYAVTEDALTHLLTRHFVIEDLSPVGAGAPGAVRIYRGAFRRK